MAGTIAFMMGVEPKKKKERPVPRYRSASSPVRQRADEKPNEFRVDADVEHNRLLLWANEIELGEVQNLLVKLGEIPPKGGNDATTRVIDAGDYQEAQELLERIRREGPKMAPNGSRCRRRPRRTRKSRSRRNRIPKRSLCRRRRKPPQATPGRRLPLGPASP